MRLIGLLLVVVGCGSDVSITKVAVDSDHDGYNVEVDCDDAHATVNPDAAELCDELDNDCNGEIDDDASDAGTYYADADADQHGDPATAVVQCTAPDGFVDDATDCDDAEARAYPGNDEVCDEIDNDCDDAVDEDDAIDTTAWFADGDEDGYGDPLVSTTACDAPTGYVADATDCDDEDAAIHPDADEPDCDDPVDYNCDGSVGYADGDGDGQAACEDCDDADPTRSPALAELCDDADVDEDCDGLADDDDDDVSDPSTWYRDVDADAYGSSSGATLTQCEAPVGYAATDGDCDDYDSTANPGATELCDASDVDEDCDGLSDDADPSVDASTWETGYADADGDGYGDATRTITQCELVAGYVGDDTDCDDTTASRNPGEVEVCDASDVDEDCDGVSDDDDASVTGGTSWYADTDSDGYGDPSVSTTRCALPAGHVADATDCDDTTASRNPGETEVCDAANVDEDCDGLADDDDDVSDPSTWYRDVDADAYGSSTGATLTRCDAPAGYAATDGDCDDHDAATNPGATEICDASDVDEDCDSLSDDADPSVDPSTWETGYADADGDGYGNAARTITQCELVGGYVDDDTDCDDTTASRNPGEIEVCDAFDIDEDCDGLSDDADSTVTARPRGTATRTATPMPRHRPRRARAAPSRQGIPARQATATSRTAR